MKKILLPIFSIILFMYIILMFNSMSDDYDKVYEDVTFTAVENTATEEVLYVHENIYMITDIHIDGVHNEVDEVVLSINTIEDGSIILVNNVTGLGDVIDITYSYQEPSSEFTIIFIDIIPTVMIILVLGGIGYAIIKMS